MTDLLRKVTRLLVVLPDRSKNAIKMLKSFLKIFLQKCRTNHVDTVLHEPNTRIDIGLNWNIFLIHPIFTEYK